MAPVPCASAIQARETIPGPVRTLAVGRGNGLVPLAPREVPAFGRVERAMSVTIPAPTPVNQARHRATGYLPAGPLRLDDDGDDHGSTAVLRVHPAPDNSSNRLLELVSVANARL